MTEPVREFVVDVDQSALEDLRDRLMRTRWPERETVGDWSQGVPREYLQDLCAYWRDGYDWRATEARLAAIPQYVTTIDDLDVHFLHVRSSRPDATPVVLTHGWPGSFFEFERVLPLLAEPTDDAPACHVVVPSLPGYGFSQRPTTRGWDVHRIARAWTVLMKRLGYDRFVAQGSDWGTSVSTSIAMQTPEVLLGLHLVPPLAPPDRDTELTSHERRALDDLDERTRTGSAYGELHRTRPQTIGYSLVDSPSGLCAWLVEKIWAWTDHDGDLNAVLTRDQVLDDVTLYWLTATGASAARLYWESIAQVTQWFTVAGEPVDVPTGCSIFPKEVPRPSRRWAQQRFPSIVHWSELPRGGHFGAWEQPELFAAEVRAVLAALGRG